MLNQNIKIDTLTQGYTSAGQEAEQLELNLLNPWPSFALCFISLKYIYRQIKPYSTLKGR